MLGDTAKKIQKIIDTSEELYKRVTEMRRQVDEMRKSVDDTNQRVTTLENEVARQRALIEAIAEEQGVDVESVVEDVEVENDSNTESEAGSGSESQTEV